MIICLGYLFENSVSLFYTSDVLDSAYMSVEMCGG